MTHLPAAGEIVIFDRSWYNQAGVEHVGRFCTEEQHGTCLRFVAFVEQTMIESGIILVKYWLEVSGEEQARRFQARRGPAAAVETEPDGY